MPEKDFDKVRRSTRVFMRVRVVVAGKNSDSRRFREACETIVINAHGGLLYLNQPLDMDAMLVLTNPFTQEEQESPHRVFGRSHRQGPTRRRRIPHARAAFLGCRFRSHRLARAARRYPLGIAYHF